MRDLLVLFLGLAARVEVIGAIKAWVFSIKVRINSWKRLLGRAIGVEVKVSADQGVEPRVRVCRAEACKTEALEPRSIGRLVVDIS